MALTPYMNLDLPVPTVTLGPEWAEQLNAALEFVDAHDHTTGKGAPITTAALNINADLTVNGFNLLSARSYRMSNQGAVLSGAGDLRSLYAVNGELYFNDGLGNQVKITAAGAINASTIGGIGGDYSSSTADAYYSSLTKTFYFDQDVNQRAKMSIGDLLIQETVSGANPITIKSPASLSAGYTITLPTAVPASNLPVSMNAAGELSIGQIVDAQIAVDAVTNTKIQNNAVTTTKIADDNVTADKIDPAANVSGVVQVIEFDGISGTWTVPAGVTEGVITASGGGGGGGGGGVSGTGGGGGAGAKISSIPFTTTPGTVWTLTHGVGGSAASPNTAGGTGGNTTFSDGTTTFTFYGGLGGSATNSGGAGGAVSVGVQGGYAGGNGGGTPGSPSEFAAGGPSSGGTGGGGGGSSWEQGGGGAAGSNGSYGSAGAGGGGGASGAAYNSGGGGPGRAIIRWSANVNP